MADKAAAKTVHDTTRHGVNTIDIKVRAEDAHLNGDGTVTISIPIRPLTGNEHAFRL